jgi:hypothetical protein
MIRVRQVRQVILQAIEIIMRQVCGKCGKSVRKSLISLRRASAASPLCINIHIPSLWEREGYVYVPSHRRGWRC